MWEQVYLGGIAAGAATKTRKLGFVAAFPIPQTLANVNAFELGARSVDSKATTTVVFTSSWCDPAKQAEAAQSLLDQGADMITHQDASSLAQQAWLTGAVWNWGRCTSILSKRSWRATSPRAATTATTAAVCVPVTTPSCSRSVSDDTKAKNEQARKDLAAGKSPFADVRDQQGKVDYPADHPPTYQAVDQMNFLIDGVSGTLPS
ncbi:MAG: BMP family ABC transporter substrate-binding protein [Egibacteraceae bacterium]